MGRPSRRRVRWVKIGTNLLAGDFPLNDALARNHPLWGDLLPVHPHRDSGLPNSDARQVAQAISEGLLPPGDVDNCLKGIRIDVMSGCLGRHGAPDNNTLGVISANTRSVIPFPQNLDMGRNGGKTTEFWKRLTEARRTHDPPLSMIQKDIAKELGVFQSSVTKWKTGGEDGTDKPGSKNMKTLALSAEVSLDWLATGVGEMRPPPPMDPIARMVLDRMAKLTTESAKMQVLAAVIAQEELQRPEVAAKVKQAQKDAERQTSRRPKNTS